MNQMNHACSNMIQKCGQPRLCLDGTHEKLRFDTITREMLIDELSPHGVFSNIIVVNRCKACGKWLPEPMVHDVNQLSFWMFIINGCASPW